MKFAEDLKLCWNGELVAYYDMMIDRCNDMKKAGVKNFDGIYRATSK
jgi:uncharacterized protein (DUF934 family)